MSGYQSIKKHDSPIWTLWYPDALICGLIKSRYRGMHNTILQKLDASITRCFNIRTWFDNRTLNIRIFKVLISSFTENPKSGYQGTTTVVPLIPAGQDEDWEIWPVLEFGRYESFFMAGIWVGRCKGGRYENHENPWLSYRLALWELPLYTNNLIKTIIRHWHMPILA